MLLPLCVMLLGLAPLTEVSSVTVPSASATLVVSQDDPKIEFERRYELAKGDVKKLWLVHSFCLTNNLKREDRTLLRAILKLDPNHQGAHEALGHIYFDDQWFTSKKKFETYKAAQEEAEAEAKGWVKYKGAWADPADVAKLEAGLVQDETGAWLTPEILKYKSEGWLRHDLEWVPPTDKDKLDAGLFKCGDNWVSEEDANQYHRRPDQFWKIPSEGGHFILYTTIDRAQALEALELAEAAVPDLKRIFGRVPDHPVVFVVLRSATQYGSFAAGDEAFGKPETEVRGFSSLYGAYFAEVWFDKELNHMGAGVAYWDHSAKAGDQFGKLFVRNAAGLSFVEGLDPSPEATSGLKRVKDFKLEAFLAEKKLPDWLRYGTASFIERYRQTTEPGVEPLALRRWALSNVERRGGLDGVSTILRMKLSMDRPGDSEKLLNESGLLVAFLLEGDNAEVKLKHEAFKSAFASGRPFEAELAALEAALKDAASDVRKFSKL